jgi:hypothetical protein
MTCLSPQLHGHLTCGSGCPHECIQCMKARIRELENRISLASCAAFDGAMHPFVLTTANSCEPQRYNSWPAFNPNDPTHCAPLIVKWRQQ